MALLFEKSDQALSERIIVRRCQQLGAAPWAREGNVEDLTHSGIRSAGHHDDSVGAKQGFVHVVRDHEGGLLILRP